MKNSGNKPDGEKILELATDTRKFEISLFWQRSLFFWGFIAAALVAYATLVTTHEAHQDTDLLLAVSSFGVVCSVAWTLANRGSKYWQGAWEAKLETYEKEVLGIELFSAEYTPSEKLWWGEWRYSVSRLAIALSDFSVVLWVVLFLKAIPDIEWPPCLRGSLLIPVATALYVIAMLVCGRSGKRPKK
ncbi:MAG TPA: hypothetical protein VGN05_00395 [Parvibaculum sp.]|jgi:hypothetical protein